MHIYVFSIQFNLLPSPRVAVGVTDYRYPVDSLGSAVRVHFTSYSSVLHIPQSIPGLDKTQKLAKGTIISERQDERLDESPPAVRTPLHYFRHAQPYVYTDNAGHRTISLRGLVWPRVSALSPILFDESSRLMIESSDPEYNE